MFTGKLISEHLLNIKKAIKTKIILLDPETASVAQIKEMDEVVTHLATELAKEKANLQTLLPELDEAKDLYELRFKAATLLNTKYTANPTGELKDSLEQLMLLTEQAKLDFEQKEFLVGDLRSVIDEMTAELNEHANTLKQAKLRLDRAKLELKKTEIQKERASHQHCTEDFSMFNEALSAMEGKINNNKSTIEGLKLKDAALNKTDSIIDQALQEAEGKREESFEERLARLRKE